MWYNTGMEVRFRRGQSLLEYVLAFSSLLVVIAILSGLVIVTRTYAVRTQKLVSGDYP